MVKRCVVYGCNATHKDGVSLHNFPKFGRFRRQWVKFVRTKRADWDRVDPGESAVVCAKHFTTDCFRDSSLKTSLGFSSGYQKQYLLKTISNVWQSHLSRLQTIKETSTEKLIIGGDARCDSMGHSAKYGSYTLMDLKENKIIAMELVQSNEVGGSYHMELEGLKRCLAKLANWRIHVTAIVTDRHMQIQKWLAESYYIDMLYEELYNVVEVNSSDSDEMKPPPNLCSGYERPDKDDAIKQHFSRFSKDL
ncbi:uncharacterized protein LOC102802961 [Saccoglossus kowalevskii]|uniref:Uncharacterized protein LOC102802961 n=1 Tax=Saccoglossus kowalevskii TaxID=10224 RepID=A0ABM0MYF8_SACKO|nr:PREDICTED: uncharacterized protein LOC102802961 [Saccoglossus kowalevskii]